MGRNVFSVTAEGSQKLAIHWFIDNQLVNSSNVELRHVGQNKIQSRLFLRQSPRVNSNITVVVSSTGNGFAMEQLSMTVLVIHGLPVASPVASPIHGQFSNWYPI